MEIRKYVSELTYMELENIIEAYEKDAPGFNIAYAHAWENCNREITSNIFMREIYRALSIVAQKRKDGAYEERNRLVAMLASIFPSCKTKTNIEGWSPDWHNCVYLDTPVGQLSWHIHDSQMHLFDTVEEKEQKWDGHTTEEKYKRIEEYTARAGGSAYDHAVRELGLAEWSNPRSMMDMLTSIKVINNMLHSGVSIREHTDVVRRLLNMEPLSPLMGTDDEWVDIGAGVKQNIRYPWVVKELNGKAYNNRAIAFSDEAGNIWLNDDSRLEIEFPYMPQMKILKRSTERKQ